MILGLEQSDITGHMSLLTVITLPKNVSHFGVMCSSSIDGGGGGNRTREWKFCKLLPYHLATPPALGDEGGKGRRETPNYKLQIADERESQGLRMKDPRRAWWDE